MAPRNYARGLSVGLCGHLDCICRDTQRQGRLRIHVRHRLRLAAAEAVSRSVFETPASRQLVSPQRDHRIHALMRETRWCFRYVLSRPIGFVI